MIYASDRLSDLGRLELWRLPDISANVIDAVFPVNECGSPCTDLEVGKVWELGNRLGMEVLQRSTTQKIPCGHEKRLQTENFIF
jgi:hypothetical protein